MRSTSSVVAALASAEVVRESGRPSVQEAYEELRSGFIAAVGVEVGERLLEELSRAPDQFKADAAERIQGSRLGLDQEALAAARTVLEWVDPDGVAMGKYSFTDDDGPGTFGEFTVQGRSMTRLGGPPPGPSTSEDDDPPWSRR